MLETFSLDPSKIRDLAPDVLDKNGRFRILPAAFWANTTVEERMLFGHRQGIYSFPTIELLEYLRDLIGGRTAIEIGAGNGVLAEALGITATDNKMWQRTKYRLTLELTKQPPIQYGPNVIEMDAHAAVRRYNPDVVIGCWVTHLYQPSRHSAGGNEIGIDEGDLLTRCAQYVVVGNEKVHQGKAIWALPNTRITPDWLVSRAGNGTPNFLASWDGLRS